MHLLHSFHLPLAISAIAALAAASPQSGSTIQRLSENVAIPNHAMIHAREDDPEEDTGVCKDPTKEMFYCSMCGGKGEDGKCKGITDSEGKVIWKGCPCNEDPDWSKEPPPLRRPNYPAHRKAIEEHGNLKEPTLVKQNRVLQVLAEYKTKPGSIDEASKLTWLFFATDYGVAPACNNPTVSREDTIDIIHDTDHTFFPGGVLELQMPGFGGKCEYKNNGENAGRLFCPGQEIECKDDPHDKNPSDPMAEKGTYPCSDKTREPVFICDY